MTRSADATTVSGCYMVRKHLACALHGLLRADRVALRRRLRLCYQLIHRNLQRQQPLADCRPPPLFLLFPEFAIDHHVIGALDGVAASEFEDGPQQAIE